MTTTDLKPSNLMLWTIYRHPTDYPGKWVARQWVIFCGGYSSTDKVQVADDFDTLRREVEERDGHGLHWLPRSPADDPVIAGVLV